MDPGQLGNGIPVVFSGSTPGCNVLGTTPEGGTKRAPSPAAQPQLLSNSWRGGSALKSSCITELRTFCPPTHSFSYYSETLITEKSYRFAPHLDFGVFVHKEHVQKKQLKTIKTNVTSECEISYHYDEIQWNCFQVTGGKKELRNTWLNGALGEGQRQVRTKDPVWTKEIYSDEGWQDLGDLGIFAVKTWTNSYLKACWKINTANASLSWIFYIEVNFPTFVLNIQVGLFLKLRFKRYLNTPNQISSN